jgi:hypothetical protein
MENKYIKSFESIINELVAIFYDKQNDYFFTEKEIHSYFYHLCLEKDLSYKNYNLVHTEYPTPFKCQTLIEMPYIKEANKDSKNQRAHIDLVLLNPTFIDYAVKNGGHDHFRYISGIGGKLFSIYIDEFKSFYLKYAQECHESVLLYAIEFKYHRHSYSGEKYPAKYLHQDINKLKLLTSFKISESIPFCENIKSLVFIGNRISKVSRNSLLNIANNNSSICFVYEKEKA